MAKDPEEQWTPDKPLDDKEAEEEAQSQAQFKARRDYLATKFTTPPKKKRKFLED